MDNSTKIKKYCFFIYTKAHDSASIKSFKVDVSTNKGKAVARSLAIQSYKGNDILKVEDASILV